MFKKVMIANRGAIACRIIRTLKEMNIRSVAVYAEADRGSQHVKLADEAFSLGSGNTSTTYLNQQLLIRIALASHVEAIHPGYGFLSENVDFAKHCDANNIRFIGPNATSMAAFALKHKARALAEKHQVPLVPGSGLLQDASAAVSAANEIGYPVSLKSSAGGGGIGMQICRSDSEILNAFDSVVHLSKNNFSDASIFLEKYLEHARHIEVQVFGDGTGIAVDLGERDCSLQRRNQKVIEEAPAPNLNEEMRIKLRETATRLLSAVHYESAGTVEYIYDTRDDQFYFLEVNTRLQVEHGVTEEVYNVDIVQWMIEQAYSPVNDLKERRNKLTARGHAIQARVYAEIPTKNFQPSTGTLCYVDWKKPNENKIRIDTWIAPGLEISPYYDPMLAKVIAVAEDRDNAISTLQDCLIESDIYGVETNMRYMANMISSEIFCRGKMYTRYLESRDFNAPMIEVISPGTMTTVQDLPGRIGHWEVGVPPSGPFDNYSFRLGNELLNNSNDSAGLEITIAGPSLKFYCDCEVVITGADCDIHLEDTPKDNWVTIGVKQGETLHIGKIKDKGTRAYLLVRGGINCPDYLGSKSTFTLGKFGGHSGRALLSGDILRLMPSESLALEKSVVLENRPRIQNNWVLNVIYGPHGAPDFFTEKYIETFFQSDWEVHYNSSRTGVRLIGPKPEWARESGGEAGMHPSNIHDNAYAFGTVDFTGDMPVILGPDGPSLGGFVCPATVINADLWKLGQLRAGDKIRFNPVSINAAVALDKKRNQPTNLSYVSDLLDTEIPTSCVVKEISANGLAVTIRPAGDQFILIELGEQTLDLRLRINVYALREYLHEYLGKGIIDLTPGIRSLQVHFNPHQIHLTKLIQIVEQGIEKIALEKDLRIPSRVIHLPLSWNDEACHQAVEKYMQSVRTNAPWCPDNIEFIRRINGLDSVDAVKDIVFNARYVVMGLGDVYLGAPVATPYDPRHRLVTTKYNPARTWTAENSVGIGGAYLCVYGMEGPGGYQFIGRTLQMWNRYSKTEAFSEPWLLRFFDQIRFYEVSHEELTKIRETFPSGDYPIKIEHEEFSLQSYQKFLSENAQDIEAFQRMRSAAFEEELQRWRDTGQFHFESSQVLVEEKNDVPENVTVIESSVAGSVWKIQTKRGDLVTSGETIAVLESMKMEIDIVSPSTGKIHTVLKQQGDLINAGQALFYIEEQ